MKKSLFITLLLISLGSGASFAQYDTNLAVGLRVGEPLGLNIRKYFQYGDRAFDLNFGTYGFLYGRDRKYRKGEYQKSGIMLQGIYQFHYSIGKNEGVKVYYGFGGQLNFRDYVSTPNVIGTRQDGEKHLSLGPAINAGLEYDLPGNNVGIFLDAGTYIELLQDPLFIHPLLSTGVRVNLVRR